MSFSRVDVIGVPMDLGADRRGVDMGPSAARYAGLNAAIERLGITTVDHGNIPVRVVESASPNRARCSRIWLTRSCGRATFRSCSAAITRSRWARSPASPALAAVRRA